MKSQSVVILTGVTDAQYCSTRSDEPFICTSAGKRILLYRAIENAVGTPLLLLSPHPRGRGQPYAIPEIESRFDGFTQRFSRASGVRKVRFLVNMFHYARHVYRHTKNDDVLIIDNYELIYVLALYYCRIRGRKNPIILEYEDGKHLTDKGIYLWMSRLAEMLAKPFVNAAILATPGLIERLPVGIPYEIVPGIIKDGLQIRPLPKDDSTIHFIYSGSLDAARGIPLLLDYLESGEICENAVFHVTGQGHFVERLQRLAERWPAKILFHSCVSREELDHIQGSCHFGLNLQISDDPISQVTYPSKTFDYLNSGLCIVSTRAAAVDKVLFNIPVYLETETSECLANVISKIVDKPFIYEPTDLSSLVDYSFEGTIKRLAKLIRPLIRSSTTSKHDNPVRIDSL